jgi:mono/diheme cytochrome c family protein
MLIESSCTIAVLLSILTVQALAPTNSAAPKDDWVRFNLQPMQQSIGSAVTSGRSLDLDSANEDLQSVVAANSSSKSLFTQYCSHCHGTDGTGAKVRGELGRIPDFTSASWQSKRTDKALKTSIAEGKGSRMPAFGEQFSENEIDSLVATIRGYASKTKRGQAKREMPIAATTDSFATQFQDLENQLEDLRKQFWALSSQKPVHRTVNGPPRLLWP